MRALILGLMLRGVASAAVAEAGPPEPRGAHPRMLLDADLRAEWKADAKQARGPVKGAIALCHDAHDTSDHDRALYQGAEWAKVLQACLVAWVATDEPAHAKTATRFFKALLDDRDRIGDGLGGDESARRDSGYAIRNLGPYTAIAYDWLHAHLTPELRAKARRRWAAWLRWYRDHGYRARVPGSNYHAGYLVSATLIAVAQGGEAGAQGERLWRHVADELWAKDMAAALAPGGILEGGDWPEGWQYGPLAVTSYALAARIARRAGIRIEGVETWLASVLRRHVYGLSPTDKVFAGGDTEATTANLDPHVNTLNAISLGDASVQVKRWAKGELARLQLTDRDFYLHDALATVGGKPALVPRSTWPTWYVAAGTNTLFARTRWDERAVWFVTECQRTLDTDHRHPNTGNFVLSRGRDNVIVDPSPYGSQSSLTSNAPTVASAHLPERYIPSQGSWGEDSGWHWATQTKSGVVAARCDYADQYRFQERPSDVPAALRDVVLLPSADGTAASLVVVDRAATTSRDRGMHLRFRVPGGIALDGDVGAATIGTTQLAIASVSRSGGKPVIGRPSATTCYVEGTPRGKCDAARFPVSDFRLIVPGPDPRAVHVITATGAPIARPTKLGDRRWSGVRVVGPREAVVVWPHAPGRALEYRAPRGVAVTHVILDAPAIDGRTTISARPVGTDCVVSVRGGGSTVATPAIVTIDRACAVAGDPADPSAASAAGTRPPRVRAPRASRRAGCCGEHGAPTSPIATAAIVGLLLLRRRRPPAR